VALRNVFDADTGRLRNSGRSLPDHIAQLRRKLRIIEDTDAVGAKKRRHAFRIGDAGQCARDDDPVVTGKNPGDTIVMTFNNTLCHWSP
jgi:hypothetical protein